MILSVFLQVFMCHEGCAYPRPLYPSSGPGYFASDSAFLLRCMLGGSRAWLKQLPVATTRETPTEGPALSFG